jgi:FkbM family methyltransferase
MARFDPVRNSRLAGGTLFEISQLLTHPRTKNEAIIRSLCRNAFLGNGTSLCSVLGRYKMFVDSDDVGLSAHLLMDGYWEMWVTEAMVQLVKPGMVVADVGANLGYFAVLMGELVGPTGWVHAFEPNPAIAERLRRSVNSNFGQRCTTVHQVGLSDHDGEATLSVPPLEPKNATLAARHDGGADITIPIRRLDSFPELDKVDFIKIDVEGHEEAVWRGMEGLLARGRPLTILLEFTADRYHDAGGFIDLILSHGFSLSLLSHDDRLAALDKEGLLALPRGQDQMLLLQR